LDILKSRLAMRQRHFLVTVILGIFSPVIFVLLASCTTSPNADMQKETPPGVQEVLLEGADVQVDARLHVPETKETAVIQAPSMVDVQSIIESYCAQCHLVQSLLEIKKSRRDWEMSLQQMEKMGVHLSEAEKVILIDNLSVGDTR
jgi:hypothetical protein